MAFQKSSEIKGAPAIRVLLYGARNIGKTHAALGFPSPIVIDVEGRTGLFASRFDFAADQPSTLDGIRDSFRAIRSGSVPGKTIVFDSISAMYVLLADQLTKSSSSGSAITDWVSVNRKMLALTSFLMATRGMNIVGTAHEVADLKRNGNDFTNNGVKAMLDAKIEYAFDFVFHFVLDAGKRMAIAKKSSVPEIPIGRRFVIPEGVAFYDLIIEAMSPPAKDAPKPTTARREAPHEAVERKLNEPPSPGLLDAVIDPALVRQIVALASTRCNNEALDAEVHAVTNARTDALGQMTQAEGLALLEVLKKVPVLA